MRANLIPLPGTDDLGPHSHQTEKNYHHQSQVEDPAAKISPGDGAEERQHDYQCAENAEKSTADFERSAELLAPQLFYGLIDIINGPIHKRKKIDDRTCRET